MNDYEYNKVEIQRAIKRFVEIEKTKGADAKEAFLELLEVDYQTVQKRVEWMLNGTFGQGEMLLANKILENKKQSKRFNWKASLFQLYANYDFFCPTRYTRKAWNSWNKEKQEAINKAVENAVKEYEGGE